MALIVFPQGTSANRLGEASQQLARSFYAHEQGEVAMGLVGVAGFTCSPPAVRVFYQSHLDATQRAALTTSLLAETGATTVDF
jgi:hypothetical protein